MISALAVDKSKDSDSSFRSESSCLSDYPPAYLPKRRGLILQSGQSHLDFVIVPA